jgi:hypothetical protein
LQYFRDDQFKFAMKLKNVANFLFLGVILGIASAVQSCTPSSTSTSQAVFSQELKDPTADTLADWTGVSEGLHVSFASIDQRYAKSKIPTLNIQTSHELIGWKGERVSAQMLLWSKSEIPQVSVTSEAFRSSSGSTWPVDQLKIQGVYYVMTDEFASGCGYRKPEDFAASLSADRLQDQGSLHVDARSARPVWISVDIPRDVEAGIYQTRLLVKAPGLDDQELTLNIHVLEATLPPPSQWTYHLDLWQHPSAVARVENVDMWSDAHFDKLIPVMKPLAEAGQKVITATLNKDPWNVQTYDPYADMILWTKEKDGTWSYDYAVFDRWVQFMLDLGVNKMINCYSMIPWNNEIHYQDAVSDSLVNVVAKPGTPVFEELWTPFLHDFVQHLTEKGWLEITNIAIDERSREEVDGALSLLKKVAPALGVSYADNQKTYQRYPESEDISIGIGYPFSKEDLVSRQKRGLVTTFYICCTDAFPNMFTFSDPAEATYLAWYAEAHGFDGMLRWAYNSWVASPEQDSRFRTWPAGDTYSIYPGGQSSIRFERMREGLQDYAKIQWVKEGLRKKGDQQGLDQLHAAIQKLSRNQRYEGWNEDLNAAKALLNQLSTTLSIP